MEILVAEDDSVSRRLLEATLQKWGYTVRLACDGREAWRIIETEQAPPLWILDWMMPGLEGTELCRRARLLDLAVAPYIILLTALSKSSDVVAGLEAGANDYITKPFQAPELRARITVGIRMIELQQQLAAQVQELTEALAEVKTLRGIIKVCSYCGKAQRDDASWQQIEAYVQAHSQASFSHGICPDCLSAKHPEFARKRNNL